MTDTLNTPQPPPKAGSAPHTVDLLVQLLVERKAMGVAKYGVAHQHDNGRDHLVDALQESLDLNVYLMAEVQRRLAVAVGQGERIGQLEARIEALTAYADHTYHCALKTSLTRLSGCDCGFANSMELTKVPRG